MLRKIKVEQPSWLTQVMLYTLAAGGALFDRFGPRPFAAVAKAVALISGRNRLCAAEIAPDLWFNFDIGDFYWNRLAYRGFRYEPELGSLLAMFRDLPYTLIDCGANFGYWSLLAAHEALGGHRVLSIEASPTTLQGLHRNVAASHSRIEVRANAIAERSGEQMTLFERGSHAGASLHKQWLGNDRPLSGAFTVETVSIDDLMAQASPAVTDPVLVKLDVEGVEIDALKGAVRTLHGDSLVIFEEYGEDRECRVAAYVLGELDLEVFFMSDDGVLESIQSVEQVRGLKKHSKRGYNLIATRRGTSFHGRLTVALPAA
jgi:FkbM family methyltransferase